MPATFSGNYLQHAMDVMLNDNFTLADICDAYGSEKITLESIQRSYSEEGRGNLPRGISPDQFYHAVIENYYPSTEALKRFARQLYPALSRDGMVPPEWLARKESIDGFEDSFDPEVFHTFFVYLLSLDKNARRNAARKHQLTKDRVALQKNGPSTGKAKESLPSPLAFSGRFFSNGTKAILPATDKELEREFEKLSGVFYNVVSLHFSRAEDAFPYTSSSLMATLRDYVVRRLEAGDSKEILKIKGPLGSYKNRIMQYLCIALQRTATKLVPFYVDVAAYEKAAEGNEDIDETHFRAMFDEDMRTAEAIAARHPGKTPVLLLDGIRDFNCRNEALYYSIDERIQKLGWAVILCVDTDFTVNNQNKYDMHPLVSNTYDCYLRIRSMNLNRKPESVEFIRNCISVFSLSLPSGVTPEQIYDSLVRLDFLTVDAYWLTYILQSNLSDIINHKNTLSGVYNDICLSFLGSHKLVDSAAAFAYEFEFGKRNFNNTNPYFDLRWRLIRKHRSVLDFLIAKYYIKKVSELNLENGTREQNVKKLGFFNMVLQKSITRFVVSMLKGVDDYERQIMIIAKKYYDELELFGKSELTFWMARLQNSVRKKECFKLLQSYNRKELARYRDNAFSSAEEKRKAAFLIRGISVSLIYQNDSETLKYYLESLLTDKIANSVNRGFHLEYYGDKPYIPNKTLLDFEDDVTKGESALTVLCLSLDRRVRRRDNTSLVAPLEVMTLCNLIQARLEKNEGCVPMDISPYIDKCIRYLEWILPQRAVKRLPEVCTYFHWIYNQLHAFRAGSKQTGRRPVYHPSTVFNTFSRAAQVTRTGWADRKVPQPENIVEHMYNCWLMGLLYLPEQSDTPGYNKRDILELLLIHDLGETETGDVSRPVKRENQSFYDHQERTVMQALFLSGTYPGSVNLSRYMGLWNVWDKHQGINYYVAKDIDNIQTIYQFCCYHLQHPEIFSAEDIRYWLAGLQEIETDIGRDVADKLIVNNPAFAAILAIYLAEDAE